MTHLNPEEDLSPADKQYLEAKAEADAAYKRLQEAYRRYHATFEEIGPKIEASQARREELWKQRQFCMIMAAASFAAPVVIVCTIQLINAVLALW